MQLSEAEINKRKYFQKSTLPYSITLTTFKKMLNEAKQQLREVRASSINEVIGEKEGRRKVILESRIELLTQNN